MWEPIMIFSLRTMTVGSKVLLTVDVWYTNISLSTGTCSKTNKKYILKKHWGERVVQIKNVTTYGNKTW